MENDRHPSEDRMLIPKFLVTGWRRLPVLVRAIVTGGLAATAGSTPWVLLVKANLTYFKTIPWATIPTAIYLWLFWRYLNGNGWPQSTAMTRRKNLRANRLSAEVWGSAILAGVVGLVALVLLLNVMNRLVTLPQQQVTDLTGIPVVTLFCFLVTSSAVAGIAEEASFRGYMQSPIERRHGPVVAILVTGMLFGFAHFTHPEVTLALMPYYVSVAAIYGSLAFLTNSILPSLVLHAVGNVFGGLDLLTRGQSEWQASKVPAQLIWNSGTDVSFWVSCAGMLAAAGAAVWAFRSLAQVTRREPVSQNLN